MRRLLLPVLCGFLTLGAPGATLSAAPAKRAEPAPRTGKTAGATTDTAAPARRGAPAPRPRTYTLAEPSPEVKLRAKRIRAGGAALMVTGYTFFGVGLAGTAAGAVLISIAQGAKMQTGGIISLIVGASCLAVGTTLWAIGSARSNKADLLITKARLRQARLEPPPGPRRTGAHALALPKTKSIFSAQLRF